MTSDRRFPVGLTIASAIAFTILIGLGAWQVQRLKWKEGVLARVAALQHAPPRPLAQVLAEGGDVEFRRVSVACAPAPARQTAFVYGLDQGKVVWRPLVACAAAAGPYDGLVIDRGIAQVANDLMSPPRLDLPAPVRVTGVLRRASPLPFGTYPSPGDPMHFPERDPTALGLVAAAGGLAHPAPWVLVAEREDPQPTGLTPQALPPDIPNRHLEYALTWFGLAGALASIYFAMLLRRRKGR